MYEYYDNEGKYRPDEKDRIQTVERSSRAGKKEKKNKLFMCVIYALVFGLIAGGTFQGVSLAGDLVKNRLGIGSRKTEAVTDAENRDKTEKAELKKADADTEEKAAEKDEKKNEKVKTTQSVVPASYEAEGRLDVSDVAEKVMPSIVSITNKSVQEVRSFFGGGIQAYESVSAGSGIIIGQNDEELLLVTNNHVVEGAETLSVAFIDDEVYEATIKGTDPDNDLAVIAVKLSDIKDSTMDEIAIATIGDSGELKIGEQVVAIGNALGYGQSVTTGIISALERDVEIDNIANNLIQTDAAINPGNSGGALLNMKGEVIGINSAKLASAKIEGMGYAIPISTATPIIEELMNRQTRELVDEKDASYIGISGVAVSDQVSKAYNIPTGVYIKSVEKDGPADNAGIKEGDVIKKFDGVTVSSVNDIKEQLKYYKAGETVKVLVKRPDGSEYKDVTIEVTLGKRSESELDSMDESKDNEGYTDNIPENNGGNGETFYIDPFSIFGY